MFQSPLNLKLIMVVIKEENSTEIEFAFGCDFNKSLNYVNHLFYFEEYFSIPFSELNEELFDGDGYLEMDKYEIVGVYKTDTINSVINKQLKHII